MNLKLPQFCHHTHLITFWNVIGGLLNHQKGGKRNDFVWGFLCLLSKNCHMNEMYFLLIDVH